MPASSHGLNWVPYPRHPRMCEDISGNDTAVDRVRSTSSYWRWVWWVLLTEPVRQLRAYARRGPHSAQARAPISCCGDVHFWSPALRVFGGLLSVSTLATWVRHASSLNRHFFKECFRSHGSNQHRSRLPLLESPLGPYTQKSRAMNEQRTIGKICDGLVRFRISFSHSCEKFDIGQFTLAISTTTCSWQ